MAQLHFERQGLNPTFAVAERPYEPDLFIDSAIYPLRVHYPGPESQERAEVVLPVLEYAYQTQVLVQGFDVPLSDDGRGGSDAVDLYLAFTGQAGARTLRDDDEDNGDGRHAAPAHIQLNPNVGDIETFVVHEFQHVLQFAIDASASLMLFESGAVYQEILAYPETTGWQANVEDHQTRPQAGLHIDGI